MSEENQVVEQATPPSRDYEKDARAQGWVPQEEFRGDKESWVDATEFVRRGESINPILRKNNERLLHELDLTKKQMQELKAATEEFKKFQQEHYSRKEAELKLEIDSLKAQKKQAIREGDGDLAVELDDRIDAARDLLTEQKQAAKVEAKQEVTQPPEVPREVQEWLGDNSWYSSDDVMRAATDALAKRINSTKPWLSGKAFFEELDSVLESEFAPEKLGKKSKPRSPVESGTSTSTKPSSNKKSYDNLPADAKAACDRYVKQGIMKREDYVAMYDWE